MALEGVEQLTRQLQALGKLEDGHAIRLAVGAGIKAAKERAIALIPVSTINALHKVYTGRLVAPGFAQRSIRAITVLSTDKQAARALLGVRKEAFYAVQFVERGTARMKAEPWLVPAFSQTQDAQLTAVAAALKRAVDKAAKTS